MTNTVNNHWRGVIQEEDVKKFVKKLKLATKEKPGTFFLPLLHLISRPSLGVAEDEKDVNNNKYNNVHLICPSHPAEPHVVSHGTFLLLELFGEAFGTRVQRIDQVLADLPPMISYHVRRSAITNQRKDVPSGGEGDIL